MGETTKKYRVAVDGCTNDKLIELQTAYKEKYGKFISLGALINLIVSLPNFVRDLQTHKTLNCT